MTYEPPHAEQPQHPQGAGPTAYGAPHQAPYAAPAPQGYTAQGYPAASYPGYPGYSAGVAGQAPASPGVGGLAITAIIVSGLAFVSGWVPFFGVLLAVVGLVLSILAVRNPRARALGIVGIVLSALGLLSSGFLTLGLLVLAPWMG